MIGPGEPTLAALAGELGLGVVTTEEGRVLSANDAFCDLIGYSEAELRSLPAAAVLFSHASRSLLPQLYDLGSSGPTITSREMGLVHRDGHHIPAALGMAISPGSAGTVQGVTLVRDLREEQTTVAQLDRMLAVGDRIWTGVVFWDGHEVHDPLRLRLVFANDAARSSLHLGNAETGQSLQDVVPRVDPDAAGRLLALCGTERVESYGDVALEVSPGDLRVFRWQGLGLPDAMVAVVFEDVTQQRAGEARRRELVNRLVDIGDEERSRLAMDLHDDAIQQIAAAAILVEGLIRHPAGPELPARLDSASNALRSALAGIRRLVFELSPPELLESGLEAAVRSAAGYLFADRPTAVVITMEDVSERLSGPVQTAAFRIISEALTNAAKHADATNVVVDVSVSIGGLHIVVSDDGRGIQADASAPGHLGLRSMQDRAAGLGGSCEIHSPALGGGTTVTATIPTSPTVDAPIPPTPAPDRSDTVPVGFELQLDSALAAAREARTQAFGSRRQLDAILAMLEVLADADADADADARVSAITRACAELLGGALHAGCAIHLLSDDQEVLERSASWHALPEQLAACEAVVFADRPADITHARTVLAGGGPVLLTDLADASEEVRRHAPHLPYTPHDAIVAAIVSDGSAVGTLMVIRDQDPEAFTDRDVRYVSVAAAQIGEALARTRAAPAPVSEQ